MAHIISFSTGAIAFQDTIFLFYLYCQGYLPKKLFIDISILYSFVAISSLVLPLRVTAFALLAVQFYFFYRLIIVSNNWPFSAFILVLTYALVTCTWLIAFDLPKFLMGAKTFTQPHIWIISYFAQPVVFCCLLSFVSLLEKHHYLFLQVKRIQRTYKVLSLVILFVYTFGLTLRHAFFLPTFSISFTFSFFTVTLVSLLGFFLLQHYEQQSLAQELQTLLNFEKKEQLKLQQFRHDYKDLLITLQLLLSQQEHTEALAYLQTLTSYSEKELFSNSEEQQLHAIPNLQLQLLLKQLLLKVKDAGIPYSFTVEMELGLWSIDSIDYYRCISILTNNALEEAIANDCHQDNYFAIRFLRQTEAIRLEIENYTPKKVPIAAIFKKNYSTKHTHSGIGLYNFICIVNKYNQVFYHIAAEEHRFLFQLDVPKRNLNQSCADT